MQDPNRPASPNQAPDPSDSYERAHPDREAGMGRLDNNIATPTDQPDDLLKSVPNRQDPSGQINAHEDVIDQSKSRPIEPQPEHSMYEEEPDGWDMAPIDIRNPREKRHPRTEGKGGTP